MFLMFLNGEHELALVSIKIISSYDGYRMHGDRGTEVGNLGCLYSSKLLANLFLNGQGRGLVKFLGWGEGEIVNGMVI